MRRGVEGGEDPARKKRKKWKKKTGTKSAEVLRMARLQPEEKEASSLLRPVSMPKVARSRLRRWKARNLPRLTAMLRMEGEDPAN